MSSVAISHEPTRTVSGARILGIIRPFDAVAGVSLWLMLLLQHGTYWKVVAIGAVIAALHRTVRHSGSFWLTISVLFAIPACLQWHAFEDHAYYAILWLAAIGVTRIGTRQRRSLVISARTMIALAMGLAVLWKAISGQYMSAEMFHHKLLTDPRFCAIVSTPVAGVTPSAVGDNRDAILSLRQMGGEQSVTLSSTATLGLIAVLMTYWTIGIELAIALAFALPRWRLLDRWRNHFLMIFLVSTYLVVPVIGFGLLFAAMAMAQCRRNERHWQLAYFLFAAMLAVYAGLGYQHLA